MARPVFQLGARLTTAFGLVVAFILASLLFTWRELATVEAVSAVTVDAQAERMALALEWRQNIAVNSQRALAIGLSSDPDLARHFDESMKAITERTTVIQKRFKEMETTQDALTLVAEIGAVRQRYLDGRQAMFEARKAGDLLKARQLAEDFKPVVENYTQVANRLVAYEEKRGRESQAELMTAVTHTRWALLGGALAATLAAAIAGLRLQRSIVRPLAQAQELARHVADGRLDTPVPALPADETGRLVADMARMQASLRTIVSGLRGASTQIETATEEVAVGNQDLSQRTEQAAARLQQTAGAMEQLSGVVAHSATAAGQADTLARSASEVATRGAQVMSDVVRTMGDIHQQSGRIAEITGVIDGLAFQTNILALNAAVEAARAGEQGRGFAVVASEVRNLAQRSAAAAREIKDLIGQSVERVDAGADLVQRAGSTMDEITTQVRKVGDIIADITASARTQSESLGQIHDAVQHLDGVTQQNAALVEQSAAAAESLRQQARELHARVASFHV